MQNVRAENTYLLTREKYHFGTEILFDQFGIGAFARLKLTTDLLVWLNQEVSVQQFKVIEYSLVRGGKSLIPVIDVIKLFFAGYVDFHKIKKL